MFADDDTTTTVYVSPLAGRSLDAPDAPPSATVRLALPQHLLDGDDAPISTTQWLPLPSRDELLSQPPLPLVTPSPAVRHDSAISFGPAARAKRLDPELVVGLLAAAVLGLAIVATLLTFV